jgi:CMP-2-keto-3-deoxyoctulosonic acid synthetase
LASRNEVFSPEEVKVLVDTLKTYLYFEQTKICFSIENKLKGSEISVSDILSLRKELRELYFMVI